MEFESLKNLCKSTGLRYAEANFVLCQCSVLVFSFVYRWYLGPHKISPTTRYVIQAACGVLIAIQAFGWEILHLLIDSTVCYILMNVVSPKVMQRYVSAFSILYLSAVHIWFMIMDKGVNNFDCIGPMMVLTEKVGCLAWSLHDGIARSESDLNALQRRMAVRRIPSLLEYYSFIFYPQGLLIGPITFYHGYVKHITGSNFMVKEKNASGEEVMVYKEPSSASAVTKKLLFTAFCGLVLLTLVPKYPIMGNVADDLENHSFWSRMIYVIVSVEVAKSKYFFGWVWADAINNVAGMGFNGYDEKGDPRWDGISNVHVWNFQFSTSLKMLVDNWNISALTWLRHTCYDRLSFQKPLLTFLLSSAWHGFFPGFFITFLTGHLLLLASKKVRATVRPMFQSSSQSRILYEIMTWAATYIALAYIVTPFTFLRVDLSVRFFNSIYWWYHILAAVVLLILPSRESSRKTGKQESATTAETNSLHRHAENGISRDVIGGHDQSNGAEAKKEL